MSLSCDQLLSHEAFQLYIAKLSSCPAIWESLSETLLMLFSNNICSSPTIEALWMCRIDELKGNSVEWNKVSQNLLCFLKFLAIKNCIVCSRSFNTFGVVLH